MRRLKNLNAIPLGRKLTIAIDIDGTVADSSKVNLQKADRCPEEFLKATPVKGAQKAVERLYNEGHTIVFHTSRNCASKRITKKWLIRHGFPFHYVVMDKFVAHVYIDDRAINGCNWRRVTRTMESPNLPGKIARRKGIF